MPWPLSRYAFSPREARALAQSAGHLPVMVAGGKLGRRFARRYRARPAHELRLRSNPAPSSAAHSRVRLAGSGTALGVTVSECRRTSAPLVVVLSATKKR